MYWLGNTLPMNEAGEERAAGDASRATGREMGLVLEGGISEGARTGR